VKKKKMKRTTRLIGIVAIAMVLSIAFSGVALASCTVPETEQTSRIETTTEVICMGTMIEDESLIFDQASTDLLALPPLDADTSERYASTRYSESMIARDGYTSFVKDFAMDSSNTEAPLYNLDVEKTFDYLANNGGGLIYSESVAIDVLSLFDEDADVMCAFALAGDDLLDSCEYVEAGSTLDVTEVSTTTHARTITTALACDSTPVILHYDIRAGPTDLTTTPLAVGSASAYMTAHDMAGRGQDEDGDAQLGAEVSYRETISVSGLFDLYKDMNYRSGIIP
jgi:hypothetical protein